MAAAVLVLTGSACQLTARADDWDDDIEIEEITEVTVEESQNLIGETNPDSILDEVIEDVVPIMEDAELIEETEDIPMTEFATEVFAEPETEALSEEEKTSGEVTVNGLRFAKDYEEVYDALRSASYGWWYTDGPIEYAVEESATMDMGVGANADTAARKVAAQEAAAAAPIAGEDYSTTNLRDELVDEADIVKTDGEYLYILKDGVELVIVKADKKNTQYVSTTIVNEDVDTAYYMRGHAADMYVDGDTLVIVSQKYDRNGRSNTPWNYAQFSYIEAATYDISDRTFPLKTGTVWQDGDYQQSRKMGDVVYLYSSEYPELGEDYQTSNIIPVVNDTQIEAGKICIPKYITSPTYLLVSSYNVNEPDKTIDAKVMVSGTGQLYVSSQSLYVMNQDYVGGTNRTEIVRFACHDGLIDGVAAARVRGMVNDTFSIDEYNGNLRVLTTYTGSETGSLMQALSDLFGFDYYDPDYWVRHNALYILDSDMRMRSKLSGIAEGEEIKSARYFGDTVYFVTFLNTDPLFTADLSDPDNPKLTGELKVSGFSSYLHPFTEGRLLGIGYEADEETGQTLGLKLSMFDVSDPANVKEISRYVMDGITWCPSIEDYKSIYVEGNQGLAGFYQDERYMLFSFTEEEGFKRVLLYDFYEDMLTGKASYDTMRAVRIKDEMYLAGGAFVVGFAMEGDGELSKDFVLTM